MAQESNHWKALVNKEGHKYLGYIKVGKFVTSCMTLSLSVTEPCSSLTIKNCKWPVDQTDWMTKQHEAQLLLRSWQFLSQSRHSPYFMIAEGSLPYSQQPTTHPCPQSDQSIPLPFIQTLLSSILTMSSYLCLGLATAPFKLSLPKPCMHFTPSPHMPYALPISSVYDHPNNTWQAVPIIQPLTM